MSECVLLDDVMCVSCGECDLCDEDRSKECNNCMECLFGEQASRFLKIDEIKPKTKKEEKSS